MEGENLQYFYISYVQINRGLRMHIKSLRLSCSLGIHKTSSYTSRITEKSGTLEKDPDFLFFV